jgi:hypothetical protein
LSQPVEQAHLDKWLAGERERWTAYDSAVRKYATVRKLLREIPTEVAFIQKVQGILGVTPSDAEREKITRIFFDKPETSVTTKPAGKGLINEGAAEYITRLKNGGYAIPLPKEEELREYLIQIASDAARLFDQPWSNMATRGGNYRIVNGNKYVKLLRFLDAVRTDNRTELVKYHKLEGEFSGITNEAFADPYGLFRLGKVVLELYCFANLHKKDVRIYNSKVAELTGFFGDVDVEDFRGLFSFFETYSKFAAQKYASTWLDKQPKFVEMVTSGSN